MDFTPKRAAEVEVFTVDFSPLLATGETITSAVWSSTVTRGVDATPGTMIQGAATITGNKVSQLIKGGITGNQYAPVCTAITSAGQTLILPEYGNGQLLIT